MYALSWRVQMEGPDSRFSGTRQQRFDYTENNKEVSGEFIDFRKMGVFAASPPGILNGERMKIEKSKQDRLFLSLIRVFHVDPEDAILGL